MTLLATQIDRMQEMSGKMFLPSLSSVLLGAGFVMPHAHFSSREVRDSADGISERAAGDVICLLQPTTLTDHHLSSHKAELAAIVDEVLKPQYLLLPRVMFESWLKVDTSQNFQF
jgi:hypothetical protein